MDDNLCCKQNTASSLPYTASDDSYSYPPLFPWNPSTNYKRKKSRLGTRLKEKGVLKDLVNINLLPEDQEQPSDLKQSNIVSTSSLTQRTNDFHLFETPPTTDFPLLDIFSLNLKNISPLENDIFSTIEQNSNSAAPEIGNTTAPSLEERVNTQKKEVRFVEPLVPEKYASTKKSSKEREHIVVKGKLYQVVGELGRGGSSIVYEVKNSETNEIFALKRVKLSQVDDLIAESYLNEVEKLENLQYCNAIIKLFDHEVMYENEKKILYMLMEKADYDFKYLVSDLKKKEKLDVLAILTYWRQMLTVVEEIHNRGIIHQDLKPGNFVSVKGKLKVIDFGISVSIQPDMTSVHKNTFTGTINYMSPEAISIFRCASEPGGYYKITKKSDVWSLGCILYSLIYGQPPFQHIKPRNLQTQVISSPDIKVDFPEKEGIPPPLMESLKWCLEKDPKKRPNVSDLVNDIEKIADALPVIDQNKYLKLRVKELEDDVRILKMELSQNKGFP